MRRDMAKVIVERPRLGSSLRGNPKGYQRKRQRQSMLESPKREGVGRRLGYHRKSFNEHLGPLRRFLDSQVGRPWDKVYSEICAIIDRNSAVQDHVRDHVEDYVYRHVILIDGVPCLGDCSRHYGRSYGTPLHELGPSYRRWYVCPRSGLLKRIKYVGKHARKRQANAIPAAPPYVRVGERLQCRFIDGAWHLITLEPLPREGSTVRKYDVLQHCSVGAGDAEAAKKFYGAAVFATQVRRLSRRELKQYPIPVDAWK